MKIIFLYIKTPDFLLINQHNFFPMSTIYLLIYLHQSKTNILKNIFVYSDDLIVIQNCFLINEKLKNKIIIFI